LSCQSSSCSFWSWSWSCPVWARGRCRISALRFLAECCKRQLNRVSLVLLYILGCLLFLICIEFVYLYFPVLFCLSLVSISQVIGCEDRLRNDLYCVGWGVELYSNQTKLGLAKTVLLTSLSTPLFITEVAQHPSCVYVSAACV